MILDAYYHALRELLATANPQKRITRIGFGIGTEAVKSIDLSLTEAYIKPLAFVESVAGRDRTLRCHYELGKMEAIGMWITEMGLYTEDGTLVARVVRSPIEKTKDLILGDYWDIEV